MSNRTKIEWTDSSWNPVTGCTKISSGCENCYAATFAKRLKAMHNPRYRNGFEVTVHEDLIQTPLTWKSPRKIFVNSMSDLFHEEFAYFGLIRTPIPETSGQRNGCIRTLISEISGQ